LFGVPASDNANGLIRASGAAITPHHTPAAIPVSGCAGRQCARLGLAPFPRTTQRI